MCSLPLESLRESFRQKPKWLWFPPCATSHGKSFTDAGLSSLSSGFRNSIGLSADAGRLSSRNGPLALHPLQPGSHVVRVPGQSEVCGISPGRSLTRMDAGRNLEAGRMTSSSKSASCRRIILSSFLRLDQKETEKTEEALLFYLFSPV